MPIDTKGAQALLVLAIITVAFAISVLCNFVSSIILKQASTSDCATQIGKPVQCQCTKGGAQAVPVLAITALTLASFVSSHYLSSVILKQTSTSACATHIAKQVQCQ
jgi:hypothetical protein